MYLLNVFKGLAGDETKTSKKEEKRKLHTTQLAQGCSVKRKTGTEASPEREESLILPNSHLQFKRVANVAYSWRDMAAQQAVTSPEYFF